MDIVVHLRRFKLSGVNERLRVKRWYKKHIYAPVTSKGNVLLESTNFALILSNAMPEYFITASFQTGNQNKMIEMSKTGSKSENRMNET